MANDIKCPICGSEQIYADNKGFSAGKAVAGTILTGNLLVGAAAGSIGKDKIQLTCLKCGRRLTEADIITKDEAKAQAPKGGCLGLLLIPLLIGGGLIALL